jgi:acetyltransferase
MCAVVIDWARGAGVGFSRIISLGNQIDVGEVEMLAAMAGDSQTRVITSYMEGVSDGRAFLEVAEMAARRKPIVVVKGGYGESGARAVASHTGALAGTSEAYDAAFQHSGVLRANTMEELFDWARALAWQPLPEGNRVAVLTNAGGPAILAVDALEAAGLQLAPITVLAPVLTLLPWMPCCQIRQSTWPWSSRLPKIGFCRLAWPKLWPRCPPFIISRSWLR